MEMRKMFMPEWQEPMSDRLRAGPVLYGAGSRTPGDNAGITRVSRTGQPARTAISLRSEC